MSDVSREPKTRSHEEELEGALLVTLDALEKLMCEANWGASAFSARTIREANEAPMVARRALRAFAASRERNPSSKEPQP